MKFKKEIKRFLEENSSEETKKFSEKLVYTNLPIYGVKTPVL